MADDPARSARDRSRIDTSADYELVIWSRKFGVSPEQLEAADREVGTPVKAVESKLKAVLAALAGKKPPAPSMSARPGGLTLLLRKMSEHARVRDTNRMIGPRNDYVAIDGQTLCWSHLQGGTHGTAKWHGSLQTVRAQPPNSGMADTLEEAKARFKRRYAEANGRK